MVFMDLGPDIGDLGIGAGNLGTIIIVSGLASRDSSLAFVASGSAVEETGHGLVFPRLNPWILKGRVTGGTSPANGELLAVGSSIFRQE